MPKTPKRSFTSDDNTYASNPGGLHVNYLYWIRSFPSQPVQLFFPLIILFGITFIINWCFGIALFGTVRQGGSLSNLPFALLGIIIFDVCLWFCISPLLNEVKFLAFRIREHFLYGCVNPGIVVSSKPPLVAVFTDLTTSKMPHYVIKILPQPLQWIKNGILPVGTKLATIALYEGVAQKGLWDNFHPVVINCVTGNQADIKRVFQSIPNWEWEALEEGLKQINTLQKPGLYFIHFKLS